MTPRPGAAPAPTTDATGTAAPAVVPAPAPLDGTELDDILADLTGIHPGLDYLVTGLRMLATDRLGLDQVPTLLHCLAGGADGQPDIRAALALTIRRLGDVTCTPALRQLTPARAQQVRALTRAYADHDALFGEEDHPPNPRGLINEACATADPHCPHPTDH